MWWMSAIQFGPLVVTSRCFSGARLSRYLLRVVQAYASLMAASANLRVATLALPFFSSFPCNPILDVGLGKCTVRLLRLTNCTVQVQMLVQPVQVVKHRVVAGHFSRTQFSDSRFQRP